jgi:hypothetical protein
VILVESTSISAVSVPLKLPPTKFLPFLSFSVLRAVESGTSHLIDSGSGSTTQNRRIRIILNICYEFEVWTSVADP